MMFDINRQEARRKLQQLVEVQST